MTLGTSGNSNCFSWNSLMNNEGFCVRRCLVGRECGIRASYVGAVHWMFGESISILLSELPSLLREEFPNVQIDRTNSHHWSWNKIGHLVIISHHFDCQRTSL